MQGKAETHPEELRTGLMDGYYDDSVPPGEFGQQHHDLIGCHAVQAGGGLVQKDHPCNDIIAGELRPLPSFKLLTPY